jgi:hypothetical protein
VFDYWHGTLTYKFQFVTNQFTRGKVAIVYEPNVRQLDRIKSKFYFNKQYMLIVDLQETQEVEVCVNWANHRPWLRCGDDKEWAANVNTTNLDPETCNGALLVYPITKLQSLEDLPLQVNVYVYSDDMRFNAPSTLNLRNNMRVVSEFDVLGESGVEDQVTCFDLNPVSQDVTHLNERHFGEAPFSFRSLLKRFHSTSSEYGALLGDWVTRSQLIYPRIQLIPGEIINEKDANLYEHLRSAFLAFKGGMRKRLRILGATGDPQASIHITTEDLSNEVSNGLIEDGSYGRTFPNLNGTVEFIPTTNGGIEFEIPFYTNNLFAFASSVDPFPAPGDPRVRRTYRWIYDNPSTLAVISIVESATAEDFSFMRWMGSPYYSHEF